MVPADAIENLKRAFPPHTIDPTNAFGEWGGTYVDAAAFREGVRAKPWTELDADFLERHHDALVFLGPQSVAEYLPAYLSKFVSRDPALSALPSFLMAVLTREGNAERFDARFSRLTADQISSVARLLVALERALECRAPHCKRLDVTTSLDRYWRARIEGCAVCSAPISTLTTMFVRCWFCGGRATCESVGSFVRYSCTECPTTEQSRTQDEEARLNSRWRRAPTEYAWCPACGGEAVKRIKRAHPWAELSDGYTCVDCKLVEIGRGAEGWTDQAFERRWSCGSLRSPIDR